MRVITNYTPPASLAGSSESSESFRLALVQEKWHSDAAEHREALHRGAELAAAEGAHLVGFQELTLSRYFADTLPTITPSSLAEPLEGGPTFSFASDVARELRVAVAASLYERADDHDGLGYNTSIVVDPRGDLVQRTRKLHIPKTSGYYEDRYFRPGPPGAEAFPTVDLEGVTLGVPTCWDQWFPELARAYSLRNADLLIYPTAIGSEPDFPNFDTAPLWRQVMIGHAIANGLFIGAVNRVGSEGLVTFYGSSFIADPYGRVLVEAPRDESAVIVADLKIAQRNDWLTLFPFFETRRPDCYGGLAETAR